MSRSYHVTRKSVKNARKIASCNSNPVFMEECENLEKQYADKRRTKRYIRDERKDPVLQQRMDSVDTLSIEVVDHSRYLHYPVKEQDIRAILRQMPQGLTDGLSKITFCLGKHQQTLPEDTFYAEPLRDPFFDRISYQIFNEVYQPRSLGTYFPARREIKLYGYVYHPDIKNRQVIEYYLRLHMLCTFIHELAHHFDFSQRAARGRWRADNRDRLENYAECKAHEWTRGYAIPYIEKMHSEDWKYFQGWMKNKIGTVLPLSLLAGDYRGVDKNGNIRISSFFNASTSFEEFVQMIQSEKDLTFSRIDLADGLHMAEEYNHAIKILDIILAKNPKNVDALCLYGDILCHLNKPVEAIKFAKKALTHERKNIKAFHVLCDSYETLKEWHLMLKWSLCGIEAAETIHEDLFFKRDYINALIGLEKIEAAQKAYLQVKQEMGKRRLPIFLRRLESKLRKKTGKTRV